MTRDLLLDKEGLRKCEVRSFHSTSLGDALKGENHELAIGDNFRGTGLSYPLDITEPPKLLGLYAGASLLRRLRILNFEILSR
jgi:hypothetical protein